MAAAKSQQPVSPEDTVHHESARKKRRAAAGGGMSLNLTPMIDVTFQLLIFFVVTANFVREGIIFSTLPVDAPPPPVQPVPIRLGVNERGGQPVITVNNIEGTASIDKDMRVLVKMERGGESMALHDYLKGLIGTSGFTKENTPVIIEPNPTRSQWQYTLGVYNAVVAAGYAKVSWTLK